LPAPLERRNVGFATSRQEATMSLTATDMSRVASELISAFNDGDWVRLGALVAPDLSYAENGTRRRADGADAYLELVKGTKRAFPDFAGTIEATATADDTIAQRIVWEGTHTGVLETPVGPVQPSGNRVRVVSSAWSRFDGDAIREIHFHIDALTLREQVGATTG
jgi:predicted ester cyclase